MDAEADHLCGGDNGHRKRGLTTCVGTLTLRIPKLRSGSFFPEDVLDNAGVSTAPSWPPWPRSRYFSEVRMNELYDDGRTRRIDGPVEWARLEAEARKMLESGLEFADRVETAWDINRIPDSRTPVRLASDQTLNQLSRHYQRYGPHNIRIYILPRSDASQVCLIYLQSRYVTSGFFASRIAI